MVQDQGEPDVVRQHMQELRPRVDAVTRRAAAQGDTASGATLVQGSEKALDEGRIRVYPEVSPALRIMARHPVLHQAFEVVARRAGRYPQQLRHVGRPHVALRERRHEPANVLDPA
jgi:hypothetical protein